MSLDIVLSWQGQVEGQKRTRVSAMRKDSMTHDLLTNLITNKMHGKLKKL